MKKILIVDDSPFHRGLLKESLQKGLNSTSEANISFSEADDKISALLKIKSENPDIVFLDVVMKESEMEGVDILKEIRQLYPDLKVIMLTSVEQSAVISQCRNYGVLEYIAKPFDRDQLVSTTKKHLAIT